jgi:hypothetical protein
MFNSNMYNMYGSDQFPAVCGGQCHTLIMYSVSVTRPAVTVRLSCDAGLVNSGGDNQETKKKEEHRREKRTQKNEKTRAGSFEEQVFFEKLPYSGIRSP